MTAYTPIRSVHKTLGGATEDTITFSSKAQAVRVMNRDASQVLYFRCDGTAAVVGANDNYIVPAGVGNTFIYTSGSGIVKVSIISTAGGAYSVEALPGGIGSTSGAGASSGGAVTNAGTFVVQVDGAALTSLQLLDDAIVTDDGAFTPATSKGIATMLQADETAADSVDEGDAGTPRMTLDRKQINVLRGHAAGGLTIGNNIDVDETEDDIKTSAGTIYTIYAYNNAASTRYLRFYNATAANTTVGTTATALGPFGIPAGGGFVLANDIGFAFDTAFCVAATTGVAANDTGAPGANDVVVSVGYV